MNPPLGEDEGNVPLGPLSRQKHEMSVCKEWLGAKAFVLAGETLKEAS